VKNGTEDSRCIFDLSTLILTTWTISCARLRDSDVHTITGGQGQHPVVNHEIIGISKLVGSDVKSGIKVGERVDVGAQIASCNECKLGKTDSESYGAKKEDTNVRIPISLFFYNFILTCSSCSFVDRPAARQHTHLLH
jgi:Zn-dependent alcohol dehydrogenase